MKKFSLILIAALLLTSCANTPDNLKSSSSENNNVTKESNAEKVISVSELSTTDKYKDLILKNTYDNMTFNDKFNVYSTSSVGVYDVVYEEDYNKNSDAFFEHYANDVKFDKSKIYEVDDNDLAPKALFYETNDSYTFTTSAGGFVYSDRICLNRITNGTGPDYLSNLCFDNCNADDKLQIGETEVTVDELKQSAESFIDEFTKLVDFPNDIKPFSISTQIIEDGTTVGSIRCRSYYKDVPIFDTKSVFDEYSFQQADITAPVCIVADGSHIGQFSVIQSYEDYKTEQKLDEIISPAWAMQAVSKKLSSSMKLEVQREELQYMPECIGNTKADENGNGQYQNDIIKLTPYWVVYFDYNWWNETFAIVNAVTGDVEFINNSAGK